MIAAGVGGWHLGLLVTAFVFGLRHGIDWDHIAAITDITASERSRRKSLVYSTMYALGHGVMVIVLGGAAILAGEFLPPSLDAVMEKVVGVTLVALGIFVMFSLLRDKRNFRMRSRWMLIIGAARSALARLRHRGHSETVVIEHDHEHSVDETHHPHSPSPSPGRARVALAQKTHRHRHVHRAPMPVDPFMGYAAHTSFGIGLLHGVGAETPTQVLLFVTAAGVSGKVGGFLMLVAFVAGLFVSNTAIAVAALAGFGGAGRNFRVYASVAVITALFSFALGVALLLGSGDVLPGVLAS